MNKFTSSIIVLFVGTIFLGGLILKNQHVDHRLKYEKSIIQKAETIQKQFGKSKNELKSPDKPDMAAFQEYIMTADPATDEVPVDRLIVAYKQAKILETKQNRSANFLMEWENTGANMGGRTRAIMFDPNDAENKKVWAGGVTGGLWYTDDITNTTENWIPIGDFWNNLAISCIAYDPNNTQIFYVGTGEAQTARTIYRASSGIGAGIFTTNDGGNTWELMTSTENFDYITDIAVRDENGTTVIYACVASGYYMGEEHQSEPSDGIFRSDDGGNTWEQVLPIIPESSNDRPYTPADIEVSANGRIFVGTMENIEKEGGATILFSDSGLPGSWTTFNYYNNLILNESYYKIPARTLVSCSPSDPNILYAQFAAGYTNGFVYYRGRYIAKSIDGGENWSQLNIPNMDWSTLAWHAFVLKVDPSNPNVIYTGGLDLYKSTNGGNSWGRISDWSLMYNGGGDDYVHADHHNIQFQPGSSTTAIFSCDGGVFLTNTANLTQPVFIERNQGYNTLQLYTGSINPTASSQNFIGGLQDNGTLLYEGQPLNIDNMIDGGDGAYCFWDENQSEIYITSVYYNSYSTWSNGNQVDYFGGNSGTFISPADYDYNENILYSNAVGFFGSNSNRLLKASGIPYNVDTEMINLGTGIDVPFSHISYSKYSPVGTSTLFVGSQSGHLYKITNAQNNLETNEIGSVDFPTANISCVAIGENEDNLLVTFSNYGVSSVWLTTDGGENWIEKESNLPDMPVRWAIFHPENNGQALLATEIGVWWTNTLNESSTEWIPSVNGMANVRVDMLKLRSSDNVVLAASHGRGLFTSGYELNHFYVGFDDYQDKENSFNIYPNPAIDNITITSNIEINGVIYFTITDVKGNVIYTDYLENKVLKSGSTIKLPKLESGIFMINITYDGKTESRKLIVK